MSFLPDAVLDHLRQIAEEPDFSGTRYVLECEIGRGGMGTVYAARDTKLGRLVAVKVLNVADRSGAAAVRMLEEARIVARLEHPGIVPVYDAGTLSDGRVYYAMKLVQGRRLGLALDASVALSDRLRLFQKICEAVAFAHSQGVIHRDLKPDNVMVCAFGEVLVMDWGVARTEALTEAPGAVIGTPRYMSPEQAAGLSDQAGERSDIYSLGAILQSILPEKAPRPLLAMVAKAMQRDAALRYPGALDLSADAGRYLDGFAVSAHRESLPERAGRFVARNRTLLLLITAYVLVRIFLLILRGV